MLVEEPGSPDGRFGLPPPPRARRGLPVAAGHRSKHRHEAMAGCWI